MQGYYNVSRPQFCLVPKKNKINFEERNTILEEVKNWQAFFNSAHVDPWRQKYEASVVLFWYFTKILAKDLARVVTTYCLNTPVIVPIASKFF